MTSPIVLLAANITRLHAERDRLLARFGIDVPVAARELVIEIEQARIAHGEADQNRDRERGPAHHGTKSTTTHGAPRRITAQAEHYPVGPRRSFSSNARVPAGSFVSTASTSRSSQRWRRRCRCGSSGQTRWRRAWADRTYSGFTSGHGHHGPSMSVWVEPNGSNKPI